MNLFRRKKSLKNGNNPSAIPPSTPKKPSTVSPSTPRKPRHQQSSKYSTPKNAKKSTKITPLKKLKNIIGRKSPNTNKRRSVKASPKNQKLTLSSSEIEGHKSSFFSNNTDGFEVVLEGQQLQYVENPQTKDTKATSAKADGANPMGLQADADNTCDPMEDWNKFVNLLLAPNLSGIVDFVYGEEEKKATSPKRQVFEKPKQMIPQSYSSTSYPHDEVLIERSAIETTLESGSTSDAPSKQYVQEEITEFHPYKKTNIDQIQETREDTAEHESRPWRAKQNNEPSELFPPFEQNVDVPEEETYDTAFTLKFLKEVSKIGIMLTFFKVPENGGAISSQIVNLTIQPGLSRGSRLLEPKLCWKGMNNDSDEATSISLLGINSVGTSLESNDDDNPFFTITTEEGDVYAFESPTLAERNHIVHGIKNVVAWLSFHLVTGNMAMGTELVSDLDAEQGELRGELPSLRTPVQAMNDLSHMFID